MILVVLGATLTACGRDLVKCDPVGGFRTLTICVVAEPPHAEVHVLTSVQALPNGRGLFITAPDVIARAPYIATVTYNDRDARGKPASVLVTMKVTPRSPNIKSITCKIYNNMQLMNHQTKTQDMYNTQAVCVYQTPLPRA